MRWVCAGPVAITPSSPLQLQHHHLPSLARTWGPATLHTLGLLAPGSIHGALLVTRSPRGSGGCW
jgi:hypothetical protein